MTGPSFTLFFFSALFALIGAVITVVAERPLRSAMGLLMNIISLAALYLTLTAELLAAIQLIVYAGAIVVLFVFVIMLIGPSAKEEHTESKHVLPRVASLVLMAMVTGTIAFSVVHVSARWIAYPVGFGSLRSVGTELYTNSLLPFEIVSITLLVAIVGAVAVARRRTKEEVAGIALVRIANDERTAIELADAERLPEAAE